MKTAEELERGMMEKYQKSLEGAMNKPKISSIVCPQHYEKDCPVCNLTYAYYKARLGKEHFLRQKAHDLNRKIRYYSNVIFPSNPSEVVLFEYGDMIWKMLFGFFNDPGSEYKGFTDRYTGRNCVIKKTIPKGNIRQTDYFLEMKVQQTQLPDMGVLQRLYPLNKVLELLESQKVKPFYQSQLAEGRTEMRVLPSWLGEKFTIFYMEIPYHYINKEEFEAICSSKVSPFSEVGIVLAKAQPQEIIIQPESKLENQNPWADILPTEPPLPPSMTATQVTTKMEAPQPKVDDPICMGTYDTSSPLCTMRCAQLGFMEKCKREKAMSSQPKEQDQKSIRETAARLYK